MITHEEIDLLNKDPLKNEAHSLLSQVELCRRHAVLAFACGIIATLMGLLLAQALATAGFWFIMQVLFWVALVSLATYGAFRLWSEKQLSAKSKHVRSAVSDRLAAYGSSVQAKRKKHKQEESSDSSDQSKKETLAHRLGIGFNHRGGEQ